MLTEKDFIETQENLENLISEYEKLTNDYEQTIIQIKNNNDEIIEGIKKRKYRFVHEPLTFDELIEKFNLKGEQVTFLMMAANIAFNQCIRLHQITHNDRIRAHKDKQQ